YTERRAKVIDFSRSIFESDITYISQKPGLVSKQWVVFSNLAPYTVYTAVLLFSLATILFGIYKVISKSIRISLQEILLELYAIVLKQCKLLMQKQCISKGALLQSCTKFWRLLGHPVI